MRALFALLIIGVCAMLLWRVIFSQDPPDGFDEICANDTLRAAYAAHGTLTVLEQEDQVKYTEGENNYGYFNLDYCYFIKEADQVQLVLFYNNSVLEHLAEDRGLSAVPPRGEEVFSVKLTQLVESVADGEVIPEGEEIPIERREIAPSKCEITTNSLYTFFRYTFDGVDLDTDTVVIYLDMYFVEEEGEESYGTLRLFHRESESGERELTRAEKKIITE